MSSSEQERTPTPACFIDVLVLHHQGAFYALDVRCYRELLEFNGHLCIVCPRHKHKITLAEGEGVYRLTRSRRCMGTCSSRWMSHQYLLNLTAASPTNTRLCRVKELPGKGSDITRKRVVKQDTTR
uniref:Soluble Rieske-type ferredoxin domain-containing protein n=1 Tax=Electrophorus electricus TaxID=8005 RepID=A0A4W4GN74_ELEEL